MAEIKEVGSDPLTHEQRQRIEAMKNARAALAETGFASGKLASQFNVYDLVDLTEYLLTGVHPLDRNSPTEDGNDTPLNEEKHRARLDA